jgi:hypothetical protein
MVKLDYPDDARRKWIFWRKLHAYIFSSAVAVAVAARHCDIGSHNQRALSHLK